MTNNDNPLSEVCAGLGITMEHSSPSYGKNADGWEHVRTTVTLHRKGRVVWSGPFHQGLACIRFLDKGLQRDHQSFKRGRSVMAQGILDRLGERWGSLAIKWTPPALADVMASLLLDGSPYFDAETFEDWADNFGYDSDSIKARDTYDTCMKTGLELARAFTREELDTLREAAQDY